MDTTNGSCFICGNSHEDYSKLPNGGCEVMRNWNKKCATALCDTLKLDKKFYKSVLSEAPFCFRCQEILYNLEFIVNSISRLEAKLETISDEVKGILMGNFETIQWQRTLRASANIKQSERRQKYDNFIAGIVKQIGLNRKSAVPDAERRLKEFTSSTTLQPRSTSSGPVDEPPGTESTVADIEVISCKNKQQRNKRLRRESSQQQGAEEEVTIIDLETETVVPSNEEQNHRKVSKPQFACSICGRHFELENSLRKHTLNQHVLVDPDTTKPLQCPLCPLKCGNSTILQDHVRIIHEPLKFHCRETGCEKTFDSQEELQGHNSRQHKPGQAGPFHVCQHCSIKCTTRFSLDRHILRYHRQKLSKPELVSASFKCSVGGCSNYFSRIIKLNRHIWRVHKTNPPVGSCRFCGDEFWIRTYLKKHESYHQQERKWKCDMCTESFKSKWDVARHKQRHVRNGEVKTSTAPIGSKYRFTEDGNIELITQEETMESNEFILPL